jgi:hypothetical protein
MHSPCDYLDDYLARALAPANRERFEDHLADCPACGRAVAKAAALDNLLASAVALEPVPDGLVAGTERRLRAARRRRLTAWAAVLSTAAALVALASVGFHGRRITEAPVEMAKAPTNRTPTPREPATAPSRTQPPDAVAIAFRPTDRLIGIPVPSASPRVTILWIYPTVDVARAPGQRDRPQKSSERRPS